MFLLDLITEQFFKFIYTLYDLFVPQHNYLLICFDGCSSNYKSTKPSMYTNLVNLMKLSFNGDADGNNLDTSDLNNNGISSCLIDEAYGYSCEFKNFILRYTRTSVTYCSTKEDIYRSHMKGSIGIIVTIECFNDNDKIMKGKYVDMEDVIKFCKIDDSSYKEKKHCTFKDKDHRPILFLLHGNNLKGVQLAEKSIRKAIEENRYDRYFIAFDCPTLQKESLYEGMEWLFLTQREL